LRNPLPGELQWHGSCPGLHKEDAIATIPSTGKTILVVDDDKLILDVLTDTLETCGYQVTTAVDGENAITKINEAAPDLILLDVQMPGLNGFEVCQRVKNDVFLRHIPVILLTAQIGTENKITGLEFGADDYITKPFSVEELLARIRTILRRTQLGLEANPLTRLPGNVSIEKEILARIKGQQQFSVLYIDLNSFKAYNDAYGFVKGDDVIRETARIVLAATQDSRDFVGHVGGDDFIVVTVPDWAENLCRSIIKNFDARSPEFYSAEDRARGFIITKDRRGNETKYPLLSVSIGVVSNYHRVISSLGQVSKIGAEMKHFAKEHKDKGSYYAIDRRKD